ncbi:MAG: pyridoxine 5'-phosphate synthase [Desulfobulbus sp.]|jgi:pyridoxine 5-phosphate synthase
MTVHCTFTPEIAHYRLNRRLLQQRGEDLLHLLEREYDTVGVAFLNDAAMAEYNQRFRKQQGPTNVLAFPAQDNESDFPVPEDELGDILISVETAQSEAVRDGVSLHHHLTRLLIHGMLHLCGYDHERSEHEALRMWDLEQDLLARIRNIRRFAMPFLAINIDHVATIRQARGGAEPDPVLAASLCELAGADGIVAHLREDRRHVQDRDLLLLRHTVKTKLNLEMAPNSEIVRFALDLGPDMVTLVPEKRKELTTEGGLDVVANAQKLEKVIGKMHKAGIPVSIFIDPDPAQVSMARELGATFVEVHTGHYCEAASAEEHERQFQLIEQCAEAAYDAGLRVNAGHGLDYRTVQPIAALPWIEELSIGHAIISRAVFTGIEQAVREMLALIRSC